MYKIPGGGSAARPRAAGPARGGAGLPPPGRRLVFCIDLGYIWSTCFWYVFWHGYGTGSYIAQGHIILQIPTIEGCAFGTPLQARHDRAAGAAG